jgi:hypothetical protein
MHGAKHRVSAIDLTFTSKTPLHARTDAGRRIMSISKRNAANMETLIIELVE